MSGTMKMIAVLKSLIAAYLLTALVLLLLAFGVYKLALGEAAVNSMVIVTYLGVTFLGGMLTGRQVKQRKFLWGGLFGFLYILLIWLASMVMHESFDVWTTRSVTALVLCIAGGIFGGMVS